MQFDWNIQIEELRLHGADGKFVSKDILGQM
jgi:hypothetical protein